MAKPKLKVSRLLKTSFKNLGNTSAVIKDILTCPIYTRYTIWGQVITYNHKMWRNKKVTGDLTDDGLLFQFEYIHAQIKKFTCSNIIILAGNHDYRIQDT